MAAGRRCACARALGNTVYLGGDFRYSGPRLDGLAKLDTAGHPDLGFPTVDNFVRVVIGDGAGGWYVGGSFSKIGGVPRSSLSHVRADGNVDPAFDPDVMSEGTNGEVRALVRSGGTLYVGGSAIRATGRMPRASASPGYSTALPLPWRRRRTGWPMTIAAIRCPAA